MNESFRLIVDAPCSATENMARDEFLLDTQKQANAKPVLRFYSWDSRAYSAGYFQDVKKLSKKLNAEKSGVPIVRRLTGGGLVTHGEDLTFSLALKYPNRYFSPKDVKDSYLKVNMALLTGLKKEIPSLDFTDCKSVPSGRAGDERICFEQPTCYDLILNKKKVVGSSQRRSAGIILHQSSIGIKVDKEKLIEAIVGGFEKEWKISFERRNWDAKELLEVKKIEEARYSSLEWAFLARSFLS